MRASVSAGDFLPDDGCTGVLVGRAWATGATPGPAVVAIRPDGVYDIGRRVPTVAALLDAEDPAVPASKQRSNAALCVSLSGFGSRPGT